MSLNALATQSGVSRTFLAAVERGESDISVGKLALVAHVLGKDVAALLGFADRSPGPEYVRADEQRRVSRGSGVEFTVTRVPHTSLEILVATLPPHTESDETLAQPGLDVLYVVDGEVTLVYDGDDYPIQETSASSGHHPNPEQRSETTTIIQHGPSASQPRSPTDRTVDQGPDQTTTRPHPISTTERQARTRDHKLA